MTTTVPRFEELTAPSHWRTVDFISDLHLQASEPATVAAFRHYLQTTPVDALFILGDLFEVWVGDDAMDEPGSFEAEGCAALSAASQRLPLYFMHGNRDFLAGPAFLQRTGMVGLADPTVLVFGEQRIVLSHGDLLCLADVDYQRFRVQARSSAWQQAFLAQPLATRRAQARGIRQESEAKKQSGTTYADLDGPATIDWLQAAGASTLVHGHTHRPAQHTLAPGLTRVVLSDWDAAALPPRLETLRLSNAGLERVTLGPK
ncbi:MULTISPECIES: UDP-2,3-diacylglucosamine diphosphatase [unclassified Acidovorax]|uniref:UDP-2,3-diacylglucosamine diphosphatase n=1 Tax=unclassified Acidovorax TaxID=2684926 RepID=UPI00070EFA9F|nr:MULTISPECIES: UDP-2,3-diacylglucosamine diphosphatase [unclassified Acidovorax]KRC30645.1 UDP-2,3-diacylglucosamine hydrolase [Acidovorax sp. Root217]KRC36375.1 UDP-2,3-diacylglucosamine hydrolase [Acidovorax sp. Root219]